MGPVGISKSIIHVHIGVAGQFPGKIIRIFCFFYVEPQVFEQQDATGAHILNQRFYLIANTVLRQHNLFAKEA